MAPARRRSRPARQPDLLHPRQERLPARTLDRLYPDAPPGTIVESQRPERFADALRTLATAGPVAALIIDYGYATLSAGDTLQAVRGHAFEIR